MTNVPRGSILAVLRVVAAGCENRLMRMAAHESAELQKRSQKCFDVSHFTPTDLSSPWDASASKNEANLTRQVSVEAVQLGTEWNSHELEGHKEKRQNKPTSR
jgi:hypothetical protein